MTYEEAWHAVCTNSKKLGNYKDSCKSKHKEETTESRKICEFYYFVIVT